MHPIHLRESDEDAPTVRMPGATMRRVVDALTPPTAAPRRFRASDDGDLVEASYEAEAPPVPALEPEAWDAERAWLLAASVTLASLAFAGVVLLLAR